MTAIQKINTVTFYIGLIILALTLLSPAFGIFDIPASDLNHTIIIASLPLIISCLSMFIVSMKKLHRPAKQIAANKSVLIIPIIIALSGTILLFSFWYNSGLTMEEISNEDIKKVLTAYIGNSIIKDQMIFHDLEVSTGLEADSIMSSIERAINNATLAYEKQDYLSAVKDYQHLLAFFPNEPNFHLNFAKSLFKLDSLYIAKEHFFKSLEIDSTLSEAYYFLGQIYLRSGNNINAINYYSNALYFNPMSTQYEANLRNVLAAIEKDSQYIDSFIDSLKNAAAAEINRER